VSSVIWLDDIGHGDRARVGGKAFVLGRLRQAGFPVPDGFVFPAEAEWNEAASAQAAAAFGRLNAPAAVRSSGTTEDGAVASFAGQYLTVLDVRDASQLRDAIERCRRATAGAGSYASAMGAPSGALAVLVQRFVEPRAAGVVFTCDPRDPGRTLVEAHAGRGEELVSGRVTPARYSIDRTSGAVDGSSRENVLTPAEVGELVALARRVETHLGGPQDVEWVWDQGGLALVQARPITVDASERRDPRVRRVTRANVGEVMPGPVTPLTWSWLQALLEPAFQRICARLRVLPENPAPVLVLYRRRLFFNLDLCIQIASRLPGINREDAERLILGGGGMQGQGASIAARPSLALLATLRGGLAMSREIRPGIEAAERLVAALPPARVVAAWPADVLRRELDVLIGQAADVGVTHVSTSGASAMTMALLSRLIARDGRGDAIDRTGRLLAGLDGVDSVAPARELETIAARARTHAGWRDMLSRPAADVTEAFTQGALPPDLQAAMDTFLVRFGHRGVAEGDLSSRCWDEDPRPLFEALPALMRAGRSPGFGSRASAEIRRADEEALLSRASLAMRPLLARAIRSAQDWVRRREHTKSLAVALVRHGRRVVQAAAARLVERGAMPDRGVIDYLSLDDIRAALAGAPVPLAEAQRRRRRHEAESPLPIPRELDLQAPESEAAPAAGGDVLRGIGVSAGVALGRARVVMTPETALQPGEILVTPVLDAALAPLLATAAGAVAEIGGILSHGSVVAREMGVPCVVDARDATRLIADGEMVLVDGGAGTVQVQRGGADAAVMLPGLRVPTPVDDTAEGLHTLEDHPRARESVYFNMRDPVRGVGLVFSMAVRPRGRGEALLTLALPDGRVLFGLALGEAQIDATGFRVGGFRLNWRPLRLEIDADVAPHENAAFPPGPFPLLLAPATVRLRGALALDPTTPAVDFCEALTPEVRTWLSGLGSHHVEQSGRWHGTLDVGGQTLPFDGRGSRDHSWGRRNWESADHWRLFMAPISDRLAVHALIVSAEGRLVTGGFLWRDGRTELVSRVEYAAERDAQGRPRSFELELSTPSGPLRLHGRIEQTVTIPVDLERRLWRHLAGQPYRLLLHENFTRYEVDGAVGYGMAEFTERPR
jgi:phosphohistidine swiveling domain-containing protein